MSRKATIDRAFAIYLIEKGVTIEEVADALDFWRKTCPNPETTTMTTPNTYNDREPCKEAVEAYNELPFVCGTSARQKCESIIHHACLAYAARVNEELRKRLAELVVNEGKSVVFDNLDKVASLESSLTAAKAEIMELRKALELVRGASSQTEGDKP